MSVLAPAVAGAAVRRPRPSTLRRVALAGTGFLACAVPVVFALNLSRMLLVGELPGHRLHQLTGQGLLLVALWLGGLVPQLRAGWSGRAPDVGSVLLHRAFVVAGLACTVAAPLGGAPFLLGLIVVTGLLVAAALPQRPRLRDLEVRVAPAALTTSLALAAVSAPYVVEQLSLQHAATGHHAGNPHFFDMAWLVATLVALALTAAFVVPARSLLVVAAGGAVFTGTAMVILEEGTATGWGLLAAGLALGAAWVIDREQASRRGHVADHARD